MASNRSFKNYVAVKFEDELFAAIESYIEVKFVYVNSLPDTKIEFDVIVEMDIEIRDTNHRNDESEFFRPWFVVSCSGNIACGFEDFTILNISEYSGKEKKIILYQMH